MHRRKRIREITKNTVEVQKERAERNDHEKGRLSRKTALQKERKRMRKKEMMGN